MESIYHSPCKINLGLNVLSRRDDGYHNIETVFFRLDEPSDQIEMGSAEQFLFTCSNPELPTESNIIVKTIEACAELHGDVMPKIHIHLQKNLPMGAGIGGGSANAATVIEIYSEHVKPIKKVEKLKIAEKIGADVPFFVSGFKAAIATGKGEVLSPIEISLKKTILLVKLPTISISTKDAYESIDLTKQNNVFDLSAAIHLPIEKWRTIIHNDFEPFAFERYPRLALIKEMMYLHGAEFALMSGSGSLIYGMFDTNESAIVMQKEFIAMFPGVYTLITHT